MKKLILTTMWLFAACQLSLARADPAAQQFLITAEQQANLFQRDAGPFELRVSFLMQIQVPTHGKLTMKWESDDHWWRRITMGDFQQTDIRNGDKLYTSRNYPFTPIRIRELRSLLQFAEHSEQLQVKKVKQRVENDAEMICLQVRKENPSDEPREVCVNSASHEILSDEWKESRRRQQYADYFQFRGYRYPRKFELLVDGIKTITANVEGLTTAPLDQALLVAPKGAIERRQCPGMKHPVPLKTPDPIYPRSARENHLMGDTTVSMTVLADGSVSDIQLIGSASHSMDDATLQTLKSWKFKPATCGDEPVVSDIEVVVSFRMD